MLENDTHNTFTSDVESKTAIPIVMDSMKNEMVDVYAAWPERVFLLKGSVIVNIFQPEQHFLHLAAEEFLSIYYSIDI